MTGNPPRGGISGRILLLALFGLFALGNVLVPVFLGKILLAVASALAACGLLAFLGWSERDQARVSWPALLICLLIAFGLLLLGGEGRFFYANEDWQIRDAVMSDMASNSWPFAYLAGSGEQVLRAPLGMYLLPSLFGRGAEFALLGCNTLMLGLMLALASTLFPAGRARGVALAVFIVFSGLDIVGNLLAGSAGSFDHLERWAPGLQYSSMITLIFWVPQHAFAGWFCALLYLLHRRGAVSLGTLAAAVPIAAIWSPLAMIGALPFVAWAALRAPREIASRDVAAGVLAFATALPSLTYLVADAHRISSGPTLPPPAVLAVFLVLEVMPFLWIAYRLRATGRFGPDSLVLTGAILALIPFFHIGENGDFAMRASIAPLAILAAIVAASLVDTNWQAHRRMRPVVIFLLSLAAMTGAAEAARALRYAPAPSPNCTLSEVWNRQTGIVADTATYLARIDAMPAFLRPHAPIVIVARADPICWAHPWKARR